MNHDLRGLGRVFDLEQALHVLVPLDAGATGIDLNHLVAVTAFEERVRLDQALELRGMCRVARDHEHERLHESLARLARIRRQFDLHRLVQRHAVFELELLNRVGRHPLVVEVLPRHNGGLLHEAIRDRAPEGVVEHHVLERHGS